MQGHIPGGLLCIMNWGNSANYQVSDDISDVVKSHLIALQHCVLVLKLGFLHLILIISQVPGAAPLQQHSPLAF